MNEKEQKVYESFLFCINLMLTPSIKLNSQDNLPDIKPDKETLHNLVNSFLTFTQALETKANIDGI